MAVNRKPAIPNLDYFSGTFAFDLFFESLVKDIAPLMTSETDEANGNNSLEEGQDSSRSVLMFPGTPKLLPLFEETRKALGDLCRKFRKVGDVVLAALSWNLGPKSGLVNAIYHFNAVGNTDGTRQRKDAVKYEKDYKQSFEEVQDGVEELAESFDRLDSRVASVGQTAANIGDHLESSDSQKNTAKEAIDLVRYMMYFNESAGYVGEEPALFVDDDRVAEAAAVVQKLRAIAEDSIMSGATGAAPAKSTPGSNANGQLEVAAKNLQAYCNELENRLLGQFDAASSKGDLRTMSDRAKVLTQFNKGSSVVQRYIASRPMFMDLDAMNRDVRTMLGADHAIDARLSGLSSVYKDIAESVQAEAKIVAAVFPSPAAVMSILVQRVMEQRVNLLVEKILSKPSLSNPPPVEVGGLQYYLRILAGACSKTKELASEFQTSGCGDLNAEAFAESLFKSYREDYAEYELTSLNQLHQAKVHFLVSSWKLSHPEILELKSSPFADAAGSLKQLRRTSILHPFSAPMPPQKPQKPQKPQQQQQRRNSAMYSHAPISVSVVEEFVKWNEEAVARCKLLTLEDQHAGILATNVKAIFTCLLDQVSQYVTEGLERAVQALNEAAALRERFGYNATSNRKVAQAMAVSAEAASSAGESSFRAFMAAIQSATTNMAMLQRYFTRSVSRVLLAQEGGGHAACCDAIASAMAVAEKAALAGLRASLDALLAEVDRMLVAEQKVTDYKQLDDSISPEVTTACSRVVAFLTRMVGVANEALDGPNKEAFMTQLGCGLYNVLIQHWKRFTFDPSGGLRLKRDVSEYADCVRSFMTPVIDEKFALLGTMANVFIVAPESLPTVVDGALRGVRDQVLRLIELRDDYKRAKIGNIVNIVNG